MDEGNPDLPASSFDFDFDVAALELRSLMRTEAEEVLVLLLAQEPPDFSGESLLTEEVETEARAQIELALKLGIQPTHLDSHMGTLFRSAGFAEVYLRLGRECRIPVLLVRSWLQMAPALGQLVGPDAIMVDNLAMIRTGVEPGDWAEAYSEIIRNFRPGVTELIVQLGFDDDEMRRVDFEHPGFGSTWGERDFRSITSQPARRLLRENRVQLIPWREIAKRWAERHQFD